MTEMPKTGDCIEIVDTGVPQEAQINVNGVNIVNQVTHVAIDISLVQTRLILTMIQAPEANHVSVRGYLVSEGDWAAFEQWRRNAQWRRKGAEE